MNINLFRGISVSLDNAPDIASRIRENGLSGHEGLRQWKTPDIEFVRARLDHLLALSHVSDEYSPLPGVNPAVCACGNSDGAKFYALRPNSFESQTTGIVIQFTAGLTQILIDGRDFLSAAFQCAPRSPKSIRTAQEEVLVKCFGEPIAEYFQRSCAADDPKERDALYDLATIDKDIVLAHHNSQFTIEGRHGTRFRSAFLVACPVPAASIMNVEIVEPPLSRTKEVDLKNFLEGDPKRYLPIV